MNNMQFSIDEIETPHMLFAFKIQVFTVQHKESLPVGGKRLCIRRYTFFSVGTGSSMCLIAPSLPIMHVPRSRYNYAYGIVGQVVKDFVDVLAMENCLDRHRQLEEDQTMNMITNPTSQYIQLDI